MIHSPGKPTNFPDLSPLKKRTDLKTDLISYKKNQETFQREKTRKENGLEKSSLEQSDIVQKKFQETWTEKSRKETFSEKKREKKIPGNLIDYLTNN